MLTIKGRQQGGLQPGGHVFGLRILRWLLTAAGRAAFLAADAAFWSISSRDLCGLKWCDLLLLLAPLHCSLHALCRDVLLIDVPFTAAAHCRTVHEGSTAEEPAPAARHMKHH